MKHEAHKAAEVLPRGINISTRQTANGWKTRLEWGEQLYELDGIVIQTTFHEDILSLGMNDRRIHAVYRFDQNGELAVNRLARALTQESDLSFFVNPAHPGRIYIRHAFLQKTFPIIGEIETVRQHFEAAFAVLQEETKIDCKSGGITQRLNIRAGYRAIADPGNALSTLMRYAQGKWEVLSVSDLVTGAPIYVKRAFSRQEVPSEALAHLIQE